MLDRPFPWAMDTEKVVVGSGGSDIPECWFRVGRALRYNRQRSGRAAQQCRQRDDRQNRQHEQQCVCFGSRRAGYEQHGHEDEQPKQPVARDFVEQWTHGLQPPPDRLVQLAVSRSIFQASLLSISRPR